MKTTNKSTSEKIKQRDNLRDIAITTAVITHQCFDDVLKAVNYKRGGVMDAYEAIFILAHKFVEEHKHVKEWDAFCHDVGYSDWEEWVYVWALDKLKE